MKYQPQNTIWICIVLVLLCGCQAIGLNNGSLVSAVPAKDDTANIETSFSKSKLLFSSAQKFEKAGQIEEAIKLYEKAAKTSAGNKVNFAKANRHLAVLYDLSDQTKKAQAAFQSAIENAAPDSDLFNDYGYFLLKNQDFDEGIRVLNTAHQKYPANQRITTNLGMALVSAGKVEEGYRMFESVVGETDAASNVGAVLLQQGRAGEATKWLARAVADGGEKTIAGQILKVAQKGNSVR